MAVAMLAGAGHAAPARLTDAAIRAFVVRQEAAWNAKDAKAWAGFFTPDARFADQARGSDNSIVPTGQSTLAQATAQAERFFAKSSFHETSQVLHVLIAPDGRTARVVGHEETRIGTPGQAPRTLCADTEQALVLLDGAIRSKGQTDTAVRCNAK